MSSGMPPKTRDFLTSFGTSSKHENNQDSRSNCEDSPGGAPISGFLNCGTSHSPENSSRPHLQDFSVRSSPPAEPSHRSRSRSRSATRPSSYIFGFELEELKFIRLIPKANPQRQFEIRKYTFPPDAPILLKGERGTLVPVPSEEQTVLSTSNGDVFAIFAKNQKSLRGIHARRNRLMEIKIEKRVKMNIESGAITEMTREEIAESLLGRSNPIKLNFEIINLKYSHLQHNFFA
ncbi:uncharacterized protein LOC117171557 [Belonocnema kinseyi]|uniref:uncharacterized protein LOC117171557 n=1 Tax=Belonocnema kinseyi TaxID=2817044 RepID=UPI00143DACC8|nr:uncharacterized protein LOC117171557 [Belonocnema kinseyi]XP_033214876.1 uncharacterized protein LOC117171557 [Belonocnema kinseyi]